MQKRMWCVMSVSEGRVTKYATNAFLSGGSQLVIKPDLCSVRAVGGRLGAKEVQQCTGVRGQRSWNPQRREEQQQPREKWCDRVWEDFQATGGPQETPQETQVPSREN